MHKIDGFLRQRAAAVHFEILCNVHGIEWLEKACSQRMQEVIPQQLVIRHLPGISVEHVPQILTYQRIWKDISETITQAFVPIYVGILSFLTVTSFDIHHHASAPAMAAPQANLCLTPNPQSRLLHLN
jgi:hypothetical protein